MNAAERSGRGGGAVVGAVAAVVRRLALISPERIEAGLARVRASGLVERTPNAWQITLGVLRMWHRVLFRSETIGTSARAVRGNWRARLLAWRPLRFPFLLAERAVAPWDFSGLWSSPERVMCHLLGAHHDENQFLYDLQMLACQPGMLDELACAVRAVVEGDGARSRWLRDLTVFDGYHDSLLAALERARAGELCLGGADDADPDITFFAYLDWCARQPATPEETIAAWRDGRFTLSSRAGAREVAA